MLKNLCTPAHIYFVISVIFLILAYFGINSITKIIQLNQGDNKMLQSLNFTYQKDSRVTYIFQIVFILFWTWILNLLCKKGYKNLSWFLVLFPWLLSFIGVFVYLFNLVKSFLSTTTMLIMHPKKQMAGSM